MLISTYAVSRSVSQSIDQRCQLVRDGVRSQLDNVVRIHTLASVHKLAVHPLRIDILADGVSQCGANVVVVAAKLFFHRFYSLLICNMSVLKGKADETKFVV